MAAVQYDAGGGGAAAVYCCCGPCSVFGWWQGSSEAGRGPVGREAGGFRRMLAGRRVPCASVPGLAIKATRCTPQPCYPCCSGSRPPTIAPPDRYATPEVYAPLGPLPTAPRPPDLASWVHWRLLPAGLLAPGDRPCRVRALALLRGCAEAGCAPAVAGWGRREWEAVADLLHVLVGSGIVMIGMGGVCAQLANRVVGAPAAVSRTQLLAAHTMAHLQPSVPYARRLSTYPPGALSSPEFWRPCTIRRTPAVHYAPWGADGAFVASVPHTCKRNARPAWYNGWT